MKLKLVLEIPDTPGQLINILNPLSTIGANITSVIHEHENKTKSGKIPIYLTIEGTKDILQKGLETIRENNIDIVEIDDVLQKEIQAILFIGEISNTVLIKTIDEINAIKDVTIASVNLNMGNNLSDTVCKLIVETRNHRKLEATNTIREISERNNLIMINEI